MEYEEVMKLDRENIWHPYTSLSNPLPVYLVSKASGVHIELESGERLIDGMSSWWSVAHGYNHPKLNEALLKQAATFSHVMFGGLTHRPAVELTQKLIDILPKGVDRLFYCDSGSVAVEVSLKMAIQYMQARGERTRTKIATIRGGYHGDTWHAMSVCDPQVGMHTLYSDALPSHIFAPRPTIAFGDQWDDSASQPLEQLFKREGANIAGFILEPIVQGSSGMWFYHPNYLKRIRELCDQYGVLLIVDEIATGFGRTGKMFASEWAEIAPDILCLGKALTGGYMSFAAVATTKHVADTISNNPPYTFMHGPTFMGNPLACALSIASLSLFCEDNMLERIAQIGEKMRSQLRGLTNLETVNDVRIIGAIAVVEVKSRVDIARFQRRCVELGVWIRPFGKLIYIMPPYIITDRELERLCDAMSTLVEEQLY